MGVAIDDAKRVIESMVEAAWLDREPYFRVHDWWDYIGRFLQVKYKNYPDKWQRVKEMYGGSCVELPLKPPLQPPLAQINNLTNQPNLTNLTRGDIAGATSPTKSPKFKPPSMEELRLQSAKIGLPETEMLKFLSYYESNGWRVGRNPMKSWQGALSHWKLKSNEYATRSNGSSNPRNTHTCTTTTDYAAAAKAKNKPPWMAGQVDQTQQPKPAATD